MSSDTTYAISTCTRGFVLEQRSNGFFTAKFDSSAKDQLWTIEKGKTDQTVAFRNVGSGQYLRAAAGNDGAAVQVGKKCWWTLEKGDAPNASWIKCNDFDNYLCNSYGNRTPSNKVWMWKSSLVG